MLCASVEMAILTPAIAARRALSAERSRRSGLELISKKQPFCLACSMMRTAADEVVVFKSLGLAVEDVVAAQLAYERAKERHKGREISL